MNTPKEYFSSLEEPRKSEILTLHKLIRKEAPSLKPYLQNGDIVGYGKYAYTTKSGCSGDWFTAGLSSRKQYISFYVLCVKNGKYLVELYKKKFPKASIGRSCIRFKKLEDVDLRIVKEIIKEAVKIGVPT